MSKKFIIWCLCAGAGMNSFAFSSLYLGAGGTYMDIKPARSRVITSSYTGIAPSLYLGYGGWIDEYWYLAVEGLAIFNPHTTGNNRNRSFINLKPRYHYGIGLIPAVNLDNTVIAYLRLGFVRASFPSVNRAKNTYQVGIGLEVPLWCSVSIRGEYDYSSFASLDDVGTVKSSLGSVSLIYRFDPILPGASGFLA